MGKHGKPKPSIWQRCEDRLVSIARKLGKWFRD